MNTPTTDQTYSMLHSTHKPEAGVDPDEPTPLYLKITQIQCYDRKPRHCQNPEYDRIKASIRSRHMDQALVVTRRPGETDYMVSAGGNTCLQILKELYDETADERYLFVQCLFRPWRCEADVILAHLRENDLRGHLAFLDKARAIQQIRQLIREETGDSELTQSQLSDALKTRGYNLSQGLISQMEYTVDVLLPVIPQALQAGMGRPQIERIRTLDKAARRVWIDHDAGTREEYVAVFAALCNRFDGPEWDSDQLRQALENEIASASETDLYTIRLEVEARLLGREPMVIDEGLDEAVEDPIGEREIARHNGETTRPDSVAASSTGHSKTDPVTTASAREVPPLDQADQSLSEGLKAGTGAPLTHCLDSTPSRNMKSLRIQAWRLAFRIAQRNGLAEIVQPLQDNGFGFILSDVPDPALLEQLDEDRLAQVSLMWWHLAACSELTVAPTNVIMPLLVTDTVLRRALEDENPAVLFDSVWTLDPGHTGFRLWRQIDDSDWSDLIQLMETYRQLYREAAAAGTVVWC